MLPPELTDIIIDYLHDDKKALSKCGRVCRAWVCRSRIHLWRAIAVDSTHETTRRLAPFLDFIRDSPATVSLIQHLELSSLDSILADAIILQLPLLPSLKTLVLSVQVIKVVPQDLVLSESLDTLIVSHATFDSMLDWHNFVLAFPNLRQLVIGESVQSRLRTTGSWPASAKLSLHRLHLDDITLPVFNWLSCMVSSIHTLRLKRVGNIYSWMGPLWKDCLSSLENLEIDTTGSEDPMFLSDLLYTTGLHSVTLETYPEYLPARLVGLVAVLSRRPSASPVNRLLVIVQSGAKNTLFLRKAWLDLWHDLYLCIGDVDYGVFLNITIRLLHPLEWDVQLLEGLEPLQQKTPVRLEYTTKEGKTAPYVTHPEIVAHQELEE